ncbi:hypothetical protein BD779DRAFT_1569380 [Infundibulicybe gibba]|nr:hypothetical protein BD779DRAFT_1569380 [Infundibulicybe gibba]
MAGSYPTSEELRTILGTDVGTYARVFVMIDALDEGRCEAWVLLLRDLRELSGIKILATSRDLGDIAAEFQKDRRLDIVADEDDLRQFIDERLSKSIWRLKRLLEANTDFCVEVLTGVMEKADGIIILPW